MLILALYIRNTLVLHVHVLDLTRVKKIDPMLRTLKKHIIMFNIY